ncbi:MAG TPA: SbcC/MukB-like Walker B domain-containing protein, partial [Dehalococcoidia bacterium]|nr:SbcC/MukB-like Walker B domain-containing protein [Dehalococcoidia bacterium]
AKHEVALAETAKLLARSTSLAEGGGERLAALQVELTSVTEELAKNCYDDEFMASLTLAANLALNIERAGQDNQRAALKLESLTQQAERTAAAAEAATMAHEKSRVGLDAAQATLEEARRHDMAASLRAGLHAGDACPVCGSAIGELPEGSADSVEAAQKRYEGARRQEEQARGAGNSASTAAAVAETTATNARQQLEQQTELLRQAAVELAQALPGVEDRSLKSIQAVLASQKQEREERNRLQRSESELSRGLQDGERQLEAARREMATLAAQRDAASAALRQAGERTLVAMASLTNALAESGLAEIANLNEGEDPLPSLQRLAGEASAEMAVLLTVKGRLSEQIGRLEKDIEAAEALRSELRKRKSAYDVAADLDQMLRAPKFPAFIQAEALRTLAEDGTRKLLELSAGRYEFEVAAGGQDFMIKDKWNADDVRSVRTLSGGETFLASLGLALALAETLPGLAPGKRLALDSLFLDEGFGSLDAEALALAADALDALRGENRMVCVVTHLQELAQRLPARVVVTKSESGSTVAID